MKPETEIRNLKRELKETRNEASAYRERAEKWERMHDGRTTQLNAALKAVEDWKARFDALLSKLPKRTTGAEE